MACNAKTSYSAPCEAGKWGGQPFLPEIILYVAQWKSKKLLISRLEVRIPLCRTRKKYGMKTRVKNESVYLNMQQRTLTIEKL